MDLPARVESAYRDLVDALEVYHRLVASQQDRSEVSQHAGILSNALRNYDEALFELFHETPDGLQDLAALLEPDSSSGIDAADDRIRICIRLREDFVLTDFERLEAETRRLGLESPPDDLLDQVHHLWELGDENLIERAGLVPAGSISSCVLVKSTLDEALEGDPFSPPPVTPPT